MIPGDYTNVQAPGPCNIRTNLLFRWKKSPVKCLISGLEMFLLSKLRSVGLCYINLVTKCYWKWQVNDLHPRCRSKETAQDGLSHHPYQLSLSKAINDTVQSYILEVWFQIITTNRQSLCVADNTCKLAIRQKNNNNNKKPSTLTGTSYNTFKRKRIAITCSKRI